MSSNSELNMWTNSPHLPSIVPSKLDEEAPEAVSRAIHCRGEELKQRELERAFSRLTARCDLTQQQQEIIEHMASAIVDGILATPDSALEHTSAYDARTVRAAIELFDPDREDSS